MVLEVKHMKINQRLLSVTDEDNKIMCCQARWKSV